VIRKFGKTDMTQEEINADTYLWRSDNNRVKDNRNDFFNFVASSQVMSLPNEDKDMKAKEGIKISEKENDDLVSVPVKENSNNKLEVKNEILKEVDRRVISQANDNIEDFKALAEYKDIKHERTQENNFNYSKASIYNIFPFILLRNIYANVIVFGSTIRPKYKSFSKLIFFISLNMLVVSILCNFIGLDLSVN
jgi:hypothetical protein